MNSKKSKVILSLAVLILGVGVIFTAGQAGKENTRQSAAPQQQSTQAKPEAKTIEYKGSEGKSALELLKQTHTVETKTYEGLGELVTSIDGQAAASNQFWAFYINGQQSQVGASAYITKDSDTIVWKLEEIK